MNAQWTAFLQQASAACSDGQIAQFGVAEPGLRAALSGGLCCDLSQLGLIRLQGPDSDSFLQGQLTCDVRQLRAEHSLLGAYCSPKGRALACLRLFRHGDAIYLALPRELVETTLTRLRRYVLRSRTTLDDASDELVGIGVAGADSAQVLAARLGALPETVNGVTHSAAPDGSGITTLRLPGPVPRFALYGTAADLAVIWTALAPICVAADDTPWRLLDILAGLPSVYAATADAFVPQMLNLDVLDGISFQKGCYTGQEVVARTHYLGKLKRRMYRARLDSPHTPQPGDALFSAQADASQGAGRIVDAVAHPEGGQMLLAVALVHCAEQGTLQLGNAEGPVLHLEALPYAVEATA